LSDDATPDQPEAASTPGNGNDGSDKSTRDPSKFGILVRPRDTSAIWTPPRESAYHLLDATVEGVSQDQGRTRSKRVLFNDETYRPFLMKDGLVVALVNMKPLNLRRLRFDDNMRLVWDDDI
jgi:hypothetical protein